MTSRPLDGLRILLTRPEEKSEEVAGRLESLGATVVREPLTRITPLEEDEYAPLDEALSRLGDYDWILFTSDQGVHYFLERARAAGRGSELKQILPPSVRIGAIGPATAKALESARRPADLVPAEHHAEGLAQALRRENHLIAGKRFLLVRADRGRDVVPREVETAGGRIDVISAYRTAGVPEAALRSARQLEKGEIDIVVATNGLALEALASALSNRSEVIARTQVIALGPVTAVRASELGFEVIGTSRMATALGLVAALVEASWRER